jgi:hypothetical protein
MGDVVHDPMEKIKPASGAQSNLMGLDPGAENDSFGRTISLSTSTTNSLLPLIRELDQSIDAREIHPCRGESN